MYIESQPKLNLFHWVIYISDLCLVDIWPIIYTHAFYESYVIILCFFNNPILTYYRKSYCAVKPIVKPMNVNWPFLAQRIILLLSSKHSPNEAGKHWMKELCHVQ